MIDFLLRVMPEHQTLYIFCPVLPSKFPITFSPPSLRFVSLALIVFHPVLLPESVYYIVYYGPYIPGSVLRISGLCSSHCRF